MTFGHIRSFFASVLVFGHYLQIFLLLQANAGSDLPIFNHILKSLYENGLILMIYN